MFATLWRQFNISCYFMPQGKVIIFSQAQEENIELVNSGPSQRIVSESTTKPLT